MRVLGGLTIPLSPRLAVGKLRAFHLLVASAAAARFLIAAVTPVGPDFLQVLVGVLKGDPAATTGPMGKITSLIIAAWTTSPASQLELARALTVPNFQWSLELAALVILVKMPLILLDLLSAVLIYRIVQVSGASRAIGETASLLWLLNPYVVFAIEMWGSPEIIPISLTLLAILLALRRRPLLGSVAFAAAIATKLLPLMFFVGPLRESLERRSWRWTSIHLLLGLIGVTSYLLWSSQVSSDAATGFSVYNAQAFVFDEFTISTSVISIGLGTVAVAISWLAILVGLWRWKTPSIIPASLAAALAFFAFYNWHPPSLLWPIILLTILNDQNDVRRRGPLLLVTGALFALLSNHDAILTSRAVFFIPFSQAYSLASVQALRQISNNEFTQTVILPVLRALFAALALLMAGSLHARNGGVLQRIPRRFQPVDGF